MIETILNLPVEKQIFYAVLGFSWTVYLWEAYLSHRQVGWLTRYIENETFKVLHWCFLCL